MENDIEKIKFHIRQLAEALDIEEHPIPALVIELDWDEKQLTKAHDIFEKYDWLLEKTDKPNWKALEDDLKAEFDIGYQEVKSVVSAFFDNGQWRNVCRWFAKGQEPLCPSELKYILEE